jgi:hypothetical protein
MRHRTRQAGTKLQRLKVCVLRTHYMPSKSGLDRTFLPNSDLQLTLPEPAQGPTTLNVLFEALDHFSPAFYPSYRTWRPFLRARVIGKRVIGGFRCRLPYGFIVQSQDIVCCLKDFQYTKLCAQKPYVDDEEWRQGFCWRVEWFLEPRPPMSASIVPACSELRVFVKLRSETMVFAMI